jgi:photosystem II stability/assembly factor-like uncharacterized protein
VLTVAPPPRVALVPNAIAFRDPQHGIMGTGWQSCANGPGFGCRPQGTISLTSDGGKTWRVVLRTQRPVVAVGSYRRALSARLDDGENLQSTNGGRTWVPAIVGQASFSACPQGSLQQPGATAANAWALCTTEASTGDQGKSVYRLTARGWERVAYTPFAPPVGKSYGGISVYGYPQGIAMARDGFGLIWESRGTLYVTRDGGSHWIGLPRVARPEVDFGQSAAALPRGVAYLVLGLGGSEHRRLLKTVDRGRTWNVVHRWR